MTAMQLEQQIVEAFQERLYEASSLMQTRTSGGGNVGRAPRRGLIQPFSNTPYEKVSSEAATEWGMRCLNLLKCVCGAESDYYQAFKEQSSGFDCFDNYGYVAQGLSILKAAKADYENGFLFDTRALVRAEVFNDFLDQATHLLERGYHGPAAVIAGGVLEEALRKLCRRNNIVIPDTATIDPMNVVLAKADVYNLVVQQRVTALAAIRNNAAHGKWDEFRDKDAGQMITQVRDIMEQFFS